MQIVLRYALALAAASVLAACSRGPAAATLPAPASLDGVYPERSNVIPSGVEGRGARDDNTGDTYLPWEGGAKYYESWSHGPDPRGDRRYFPIEVWLQGPSDARKYQALSINVYNGLWKGPTRQQLAMLAGADMPVFASQNSVGLTDPDRYVLKAWDQVDEPDDAQPKHGGGYGPCIPPAQIIRRYDKMRANDPTRPVFLNFSQAVANPKWPGRGSCTGDYGDYPKYIEGADIISYDLYPINNSLPLWWVAKGIDRLRAWAHYKKPVYEWFETTPIDAGNAKPTPADVRSEVWLSLIHGALGVGYFTYVFTPEFNAAALLDEPSMAAAVTAIDTQIEALAPALNTPSVANGVTVRSSNGAVPVDTMLKRADGDTYLFAASARDAGATEATFSLRGLTKTVVADVLGEHRTIVVRHGTFQDAFTGYEVHLYRIPFVPQ